MPWFKVYADYSLTAKRVYLLMATSADDAIDQVTAIPDKRNFAEFRRSETLTMTGAVHIEGYLVEGYDATPEEV